VKATGVTAGLAESNGGLLPSIWRDSLHVTCGLTACTPGSAPGPTLGNEYGKTLPLPYLLQDTSPRSSLPSLEDSITAKLLELQQLEADDCRVVREFVTSARGGIVHRGDSFRRNKENDARDGRRTER